MFRPGNKMLIDERALRRLRFYSTTINTFKKSTKDVVEGLQLSCCEWAGETTCETAVPFLLGE